MHFRPNVVNDRPKLKKVLFRSNTAGEFCQHSAKEPHSTRAPASEPVLWLYFWSGEIDGEYWFIEQEVEAARDKVTESRRESVEIPAVAANAVRRLSLMPRINSLPLIDVHSRRKSVVKSRKSEIWSPRLKSLLAEGPDNIRRKAD